MVKNSMRRLLTVLIALVLIAGFMLVDSNAQKRRRASLHRALGPVLVQADRIKVVPAKGVIYQRVHPRLVRGRLSR